MMRDLDRFRPDNILIRERGEHINLAATWVMWSAADVHRNTRISASGYKRLFGKLRGMSACDPKRTLAPMGTSKAAFSPHRFLR